MLKELISLFADSFITNKSEWVGRQAYPSRRITLSSTITEYVPPADGFLGVYKNKETSGNSIDVYSFGPEGQIISRTTLAFPATSDIFAFSAVLPVKKGYRVAFTGSFNELWFSPAVGSKY